MTLALPAAARPRTVASVAAVGALLASLGLAAWWQATCPVNTDEAWLLDVAGCVLDGGRFYVDFVEVNPPASILLYVPAVALARAIAISPIDAVRLLVGLAFTCSLGLCAAILRPAGLLRDRNGPALLAVAVAALILLPMYAFGQREHIAVLACLPMLAGVVARASLRPPALGLALLAGLGGGIALCIKPMFGLGLVGPAAYLALSAPWRETWRWWEAWVAILVAGAYGVAVLVFCPIFAETMLPMALAVYVPDRQPLLALLLSPGFVVWLLLSGIVVAAGRQAAGPRRLEIVLLLAAAGFQAAALQQGKGFAYHSYPALALAVLAAALPIARLGAAGAAAPRQQLVEVVLVGFSFVCGLSFFTRHYDPAAWAPGLVEAIHEVAPHPTMMAITAELALGHPFAETLGGRWVGRTAATWISAAAYKVAGGPAKVGALGRYVDWERAIVAADVASEKPDVILIDDDGWMKWIAGSPAMAQAFAAYRRKGVYDTVAVWARSEAKP